MSGTFTNDVGKMQRRPILAILGIVFALALGYHVPIVGILTDAADPHARQQLGRLHFFSVGFTSWFAALALFQLFVLLKHRWLSTDLGLAPVANPFDRKVVAVTLAFAGLHWFGLLTSMVPMFTGMSLSNGQLLIGIVSGLAGASVLIYLGGCIDRWLPGFGFWVLVACSTLYGFSASIINQVEFLLTGAVARNVVVVSILLLLLCVVSAIFLTRERADNSAFSAPSVFASLLLSSILAQWLLPLVYVTLEPHLGLLAGSVPEVLNLQAYRVIAVLVQYALVLVIMTMFAPRRMPVWRRWDVAVAFLVLLFSAELNVVLGGLMWSDLSLLTWLIVAWAASRILAGYLQHSSASAPPPSDDAADFDEGFRRGWRR